MSFRMSKKAILTADSAETVPAAGPVVVNGGAATVGELPKLPKTLPPDEFWRVTHTYPDRRATVYYLYRLWPKIDRKLAGSETALLDKQLEMDEDYIERVHGGGEYEVYFRDENRRGQGVKTSPAVCIDATKVFPVVNQAELVIGHPKNAGFIEQLKARGMWDRDKPKGANVSDTAAAAAVQEIAGLARAAMERGPAPDESAMQQAMTGAVSILSDAYGAAAKSLAGNVGGGTDRVVMELLLKRMDQQHEMMLKFMDRDKRVADAPGIEGQLKTLEVLTSFADKLATRGAPAASSWADRLPDWIGALLPPLMQGLAQQQPRYVPEGPAYVPAAGVGQTAPPAAPPAANPGSTGEDDMSRILAAFGLPAQAAPFLRVGKRALRAYQEGFSGAAFAEVVDRIDGAQVYNDLAAFGADGIVEVLRGLPAALLGPDAAAVVAAPEFAAWIRDFMAYADVEPEPAGGNVGDASEASLP